MTKWVYILLVVIHVLRLEEVFNCMLSFTANLFYRKARDVEYASFAMLRVMRRFKSIICLFLGLSRTDTLNERRPKFQRLFLTKSQKMPTSSTLVKIESRLTTRWCRVPISSASSAISYRHGYKIYKNIFWKSFPSWKHKNHRSTSS